MRPAPWVVRATSVSPARDQDPSPKTVDDSGSEVHDEPLNRRIQGGRRHEAMIGFSQDQKRGHDDHHTLKHSGIEFCLMVAIGMVGVGGLGRDMNRNESGKSCRDIDRAFERVR